MIETKPQPRKGEPMCSCGNYPMRFCVSSWAYCGKQAVAVSNHWRTVLGVKRPDEGEKLNE